MTRADAKRLVALLLFAFPQPQPPDGTAALWIERLQRLDDAAAAEVAIGHLIDTETWFPTIAAFLDAYRTEVHRAAEERAWRDGLAEKDLDDEARAENLARVRELLAHLNVRGMDDAA